MINYKKRSISDPLMWSNAFFLVPVVWWIYLECYFYTIVNMCVFTFSCMYHRCGERKYLYHDMGFSILAFSIGFRDNLIYNSLLFWVSMASCIGYYVFLCKLWREGRCSEYRVWHSIWHVWASATICVSAYITGINTIKER